MLMNFYWRKNNIQNIFAIGNITLKLTVKELASTQRILRINLNVLSSQIFTQM